MDYTQIKYEKADRILTITLNRPEKLNAVSVGMLPELIDALGRADEDDDVRVVIMTGAGRGFCAGKDLSSTGRPFDHIAETMEEWRDGGGVLTMRMYDMKKPLIAAINGAATGIGITMTLPMDIRLASENARIGFVFARRGLTMEACSSWFLPRIVGISKANEWTLTGRLFDAHEALAGRLVSEVTTPENLMPRAREIAREIADNTSAISVALNRQMQWKMLGANHPMEAHKIDSMSLFWVGRQADGHEGVAAWAEKRKPDFKMKPSSEMPPFYPWWRERSFETR
ncbi:MAG: crotonase/enoyl-CoA hydratase family protein [Dehalococcoidia bacterium]|nr:crotonase/enoyl-CoA hydratase family protein [Dehalococcoidia bacterium]